MNNPVRLNTFQFIEFAASSFLPLTVWFFPRTAIETAGMDGQWAVLGLILVGFLMAWIHGWLNERFSSLPGSDMAKVVFGKWVGNVVNTCYLVVYIPFVSLCIYFFAKLLNMYLQLTPTIVEIIALTIVAGVGAWYGVETIGRSAVIIHPLMWVIGVIIFVTAIFHADWHGISLGLVDFRATVYGTYKLLPIFLGFNAILMLSPYVRGKGRTPRYLLFVIVETSFLLVTGYVSVTGTIGWTVSKHVTYPIPFVMQLMRLHGWIIERVGILNMFLITAFAVVFVTIHIWAISVHVARISGLHDKNFTVLVLPVSVVIATVAGMIDSDTAAFHVLNVIMTPVSWLLLIAIPLVMMILAKVRKLESKQESPSLKNQ